MSKKFNEEDWQDISRILEDILSIKDEIHESVKQTVEGTYMSRRGEQWAGTIKDGDKYSSTGKTREEREQILSSTDLSDTTTALSSIQTIISAFEKNGYAVLSRIREAAEGLRTLELQMVPRNERDFFGPQGRGTKLGIKPYSCTYPGCNKRYSGISRLKIHLRTHVRIFIFTLHRQGKSHSNVPFQIVISPSMRKEI